MFEIGQHIAVNGMNIYGYALYLHHGIVSRVLRGSCTHVIHYQRAKGEKDFIIREDTFDTFHEGWDSETVQVIEHKTDAKCKYTTDQAEQRARKCLGNKEFRYLTNNCESFCEWCYTDDAVSYQVRSAAWIAVSALCIATAAATAKKKKSQS